RVRELVPHDLFKSGPRKDGAGPVFIVEGDDVDRGLQRAGQERRVRPLEDVRRHVLRELSVRSRAIQRHRKRRRCGPLPLVPRCQGGAPSIISRLGFHGGKDTTMGGERKQ
ncbi:unnamed protein product, partial [Ectocarpus sp. 8 AP-2014]